MPSAKSQQKSLAESIASWRDGSEGFFAFVEAVQPVVRSPNGGFAPYKLSDVTREAIANVLDNPGVSVGVFCFPRRHGKSATSAMLMVWRFVTRVGETCAVVANSERQTVDTLFRTVRECFENTPFLQRLITAGTIKIGADKVEMPSTGSTIQAFSCNPGALWGKKLSTAALSELHAAPKGDQVFEALAGSLLDTTGSLLLVDSTVSAKSNLLWELYQSANHPTDPDKSIAFSHISYADLDEACAKSPPWIDPTKLRSLSRQMIPTKFSLLHLNRWGDASNLLLPASVLDPCIHEYPLDPKAIAAGGAYIVGAGLDRAYGMTARGDATVCAAVCKVNLDDADHIFVLEADSVPFSRMGGIKSRFDRYHSDFGMTRLTLESYGAQDIYDWAQTRPYSGGTEVVNPSRRLKAAAFTSLYQYAAEGRLHVSPVFKSLIAEMRVFEVTDDGRASDGEASIPKFSHPRGAHDDFLHAVCWAIYSLRSTTLNPYELDGINCLGRGPAIQHCALNGGGLIPACADSCRSMTEARKLHDAYLARGPLAPVELPQFILEKVTNTGAHSLPR